MRKILKKLFHLPGPKELGWSKHDALGSSRFTPDQEGPTWEDWEALMRKDYAFAYFMTHTLPEFFGPLKWWLRHKKEWLQAHLYPSKYDFYKISLVGVDPLNPTKYGYMDPCETLRLSVWYSLVRYVEKCKTEDPLLHWTAEEIEADPILKDQKKAYDEIIELYNWWKVGQVEEEAKGKAFYAAMDLARTSGDKEKVEEFKKLWRDSYKSADEKQEEMLLRVVKLRNYLWN